MMKISDAVDILHDLALEMGDPPDDTCITNPDEDNIEAINLAIGILSVLDANKAKATAVATALHICGTPKVGCPPICPYSNVGDKCISSLELDAELLLTLAYLQGGGSDDQR